MCTFGALTLQIKKQISVLLPGSESGTKNEFSFATPSQTEQKSNDIFDPFGSLGAGGDTTNLLGGWSNFNSSAPAKQAEEKVDFFAGFGV